MLFTQALRASTTHKYDYLHSYVADLESVVDMAAIRDSKISLGVDPLGGAGIDYWPLIKERYALNLTVVNQSVDPTFRFMTVDWDGKIRMDPSSPYAMQRLIGLKDKFDIAFGADTDHDRHGIVTKGSGLLPPNHYLSVCIHYLFANRKDWGQDVAVGKTVVSSSMIDRVTARLGRRLYEVPVGFKWYVEGLLGGRLGFAGEESAGASFLGFDAGVWATDKDGIIPCLLSAEITARMGKDPGEIYAELTRDLGDPIYERIEAPATPGTKGRAREIVPGRHPRHRGRRREDREDSHRRSGRRQPDRWNQSDRKEWLVCGSPFGYRTDLQDLRGKFSRPGSSAAHPRRSADNCFGDARA